MEENKPSEEQKVQKNLSDILKDYLQSNNEIAQVLAIMLNRIEAIEKALNEPLIKKS